MNVFDAVKKGFEISGKSRGLVLVLFVFSFVWNLVNIPINNQMQSANPGISVAVVILSLLFIAMNIFMQSGSLGYVLEVLKTGASNFNTFVASGKKYYLRVFGISVLVGLFVIILAVLAALAILIGGENPNAISIVVALIIGAFGVYGVFLVFLSPYILVTEDAKVVDSIKLSIALVKKNFLAVLSLGLVLLLIGFGVGLLMGLVFGLLGALIKGVAGQVIFGFVGSVINSYLSVVVTSAIMVYYLSLRSGPGATAAS